MLFQIRIIFLYLLVLGCFKLYSQTSFENIKIPDSISQMGYNELYRNYAKHKQLSPDKSYVFAYAYLQNAKKDKKKYAIAEGYQYTSSFGETEIQVKYIDSAINLYKDDANYMFPGNSYLKKGFLLFGERNFKEAIDNLLIANKLARKHSNSSQVYYSNYLIAMLTDRIGNHKDAIKILKEYPRYIVDKKITKIDTVLYLQTNFGLAVASYKLDKLDSSAYYNDIGLKISSKSKNTDFYNHFVLSSGATLFHKKKYEKSFDSIEKSLIYFKNVNNKPNLAVAYFYKGKILFETGEEEKGIVFFKKLDTIFQQQHDILPETREGYELLIDYYKEKKDIASQLLYTQKLVEVDKVLNLNYKHVQTNIIKDYYTPLLITKKIEEGTKSNWVIIYSILIVLVITIIILIYSFYRQRVYKKKFKILIEKESTAQNIVSLSKIDSNNNNSSLKQLNISEDIVNTIMSGLEEFESTTKFINSKYTLTILAKELKTNSSYLSKVINVTKEKNFSNYISDLRIDYVVNRLKSDTKFRMYSIRSISEEIGFKNTESFSKAFHRKTGIYPSYFIKNLLKEQI